MTTCRIYLAGPINGCTDGEAKDWRNWMKDVSRSNIAAPSAHVEFIDPMRRDYRGVEAVRYREVVDLDKRDILQADIVVVMYEKPSVGTSMEVLFAWEHNKAVVVIAKAGTLLSPWLLYHSTCVVESLEAAAAKLCELIRS
jgi:nucleoside 2-deoxyribosyltransferase